jgi:hypothetical protein
MFPLIPGITKMALQNVVADLLMLSCNQLHLLFSCVITTVSKRNFV